MLILLLIQKIILLITTQRKYSIMPLTFYSILSSYYLIYNFMPVLEYGLVTPDEEKHRWDFIFHQKDYFTEKLRTTSLLNHLNLYLIS